MRSHRRQAHLFFAKPDQHLAHAPQFGHFAKHQVKRLLDALIRILLDLTVSGPREPDGNRNPQLAATGFLVNRLERPLSNEAPFVLTHLALQTEQQPVI